MVFDRFPGRWIVTQLEENVPAQQFWRAVIHRYTRGNFEDRHLRERRRIVQEFAVQPE
jgi:predicted acetyltransferase